MKCWPLFHDHRPVRVEQYEDVSFGRPGIRQSRVLQLCARCGHARTRTLAGSWTLADFTPPGTVSR